MVVCMLVCVVVCGIVWKCAVVHCIVSSIEFWDLVVCGSAWLSVW